MFHGCMCGGKCNAVKSLRPIQTTAWNLVFCHSKTSNRRRIAGMGWLYSRAAFAEAVLCRADTGVDMRFKARLEHGGENLTRDISERDTAAF